MMKIRLPDVIADLHKAHVAMVDHYSSTRLTFTLDGKLVGDIGEAVAAAAFGLTICERRTAGVDAHAPDGRSVQIKATGKSDAGPSFTPGEGTADHLLFLRIDFRLGTAEIAYNGPEAPVRALLPRVFTGSKRVRLVDVQRLDAGTPANMRLYQVV